MQNKNKREKQTHKFLRADITNFSVNMLVTPRHLHVEHIHLSLSYSEVYDVIVVTSRTTSAKATIGQGAMSLISSSIRKVV